VMLSAAATPIAVQLRFDPAILISWLERHTLHNCGHLALDVNATPIIRGDKSADTLAPRQRKHRACRCRQIANLSALTAKKATQREGAGCLKPDTSTSDQQFLASTRRRRGRRFVSCSQRRTGHNTSFSRFPCRRADLRADLFACTQLRLSHIFLFCTRRQPAKHEP